MGSYYTDFVEDDESESVTEELGASLNETLGNLTIPDLPNCEKIHLGNIVECFASAERYRRSMDVNAMRYFLFLKKEMISKAQSPRSQTIATWREIVWAFHSVSQDALVDLMQRQFHGRMQWEDARGSGIFMWMTDLPALVSLMYHVMTNPRLTECPASSIRSDSKKRVHKNLREEPYRLQPLLSSSQEKVCSHRSMENGSVEPRAIRHTKAPPQRFYRVTMENGSFEKRLRFAWKASI